MRVAMLAVRRGRGKLFLPVRPRHPPRRPEPRHRPLAFLASSVPAAALRRHPAHPGCAASPLRRVQRRTAAPRPLAPKPLEKRRRPVQFAPIWPISVHYSDHSRHVARSRAQRPRSTALGCHTARRTFRRRSSAAATPRRHRQAVPSARPVRTPSLTPPGEPAESLPSRLGTPR